MMSQMVLLNEQVMGGISKNNEVKKVSRLDEDSHPGPLKSGGN